MRLPVLGVLVALALGAATPPRTSVRVWHDTLQIPTYGEGPANPNPPFDLFSFGRFNYPYPMRDALTNTRDTVTWRTLNLENEYLRLTVLPDLGGHIYSCLDKRNGREMFYANTAIKKALIGYRGAWAALGVEFNFPVSHNWMSVSPVDFATGEHADGSASIWVGNVDRMYGSQWRVELRLAPGEALLRQNVELYNRSDVRHRYYWWSNGAVRVWEDSHLEYPTELMATHGFTRIERWPIDDRGRDLSIIRNETDGPVSLFTYGTREPFVGVYHPHTNSGTIHVADPAELPVHKFWSWGYDRDAADWRQALSDDDSGYVELQAGLFRNQETYAFLEPQESVRFSEFWLPVRDLGGITRANTSGVLYMTRPEVNRVHLALDVARQIDGRITVRNNAATLADTAVRLSPRDIWTVDVSGATTAPLTFRLTDSGGTVLLEHTENVFDRTPAAAAPIGPQPDMRSSGSPEGSASAMLERGQVDELEGRRLQAMGRYREGLERYPHTLALLKAAGRLAVALGWAEADTGPSRPAIGWLEEARARNTTDAEVDYYLGLALEGAGRAGDARPHFEAAARFRGTRPQASLQLARLLAREGDVDGALHELRSVDNADPRTPLAAELQVALLRRAGRTAGALERARYWRGVDPTSGLLRNELELLGERDSNIWTHFGADASRVLDVVDQYLTIGAYDDALTLLERKYPALEPPMREPGAVPPNRSPLVCYYRGYVRQQLGGDPLPDYEAARLLPTTYVFPMRHSTYAVLRSALHANANDATAGFLLGSLYLSAGLVEPAIDQWQRVRALHAPPIPTLHRNLALALLYGPGNHTEAQTVLQEGLGADPSNVEIYTTLDGVLSAANADPRERVAALRRFPANGQVPAAMTSKLAIALAEAGAARESEQLFHDRFFPREEGGTSVRAVYTQSRLASAAVDASRHDCAAALAILDGLAHEQPGLAFTAGGLADTLRPPQVAMQAAAIESECGRLPAARARWEQLERGFDGRGGPVAVAIADAARERLGHERTPDQRQQLERALEGVTRSLEAGDTSNPGFTEYARALLLRALGRAEDAQRSLNRVFVFPDRSLSHALARASRTR